MDSDAQHQFLFRPVPDREGLHFGKQVKGHGGDFRGVFVVVVNRKAADHHVSVAYGLHLVDVVVFDDGVEAGVEVVQEVDDLQTVYFNRMRRKCFRSRHRSFVT